MIKIKAVIWDMGGVLLRTENRSFRTVLAKKHGVTEKQLEHSVFDSETAKLATWGKISAEEHWQSVARCYSLDETGLAAFKESFWGGDQVDRELMSFIDSLRPEYKTALLSNAWSDARTDVAEPYRLLDVFDFSVFSAEIRLAKPDSGIYKFVLEKIKVQPEEAVFVDDMPANVEAACNLGINGLRFQNSQQVLSDIAKLLH